MANQFEETETDEEYQEFDTEEEHEADVDENFILNVIQDGGDESDDEEELMFVLNIRTATGGRHSDESSDDSDSSDESKGSKYDSSEHGETSSEREMVKYETTNRFGRKFIVLRTTNITCSISDKLNI